MGENRYREYTLADAEYANIYLLDFIFYQLRSRIEMIKCFARCLKITRLSVISFGQLKSATSKQKKRIKWNEMTFR